VKRRSFMTLLGGAAVTWPLAARAQQPKMSVIGYLGAGSAAASASTLAVFRQSLAGAGYAEGRNIGIEYRFAEGRYDRLPEMAAELVRQQVSLIVATGGTAPALAAKAATATLPIVFTVTDDPVSLGLVVSFARPGGNATGVNFPLAELAAKELGLLHELVPAARRIGLLVNPNNSPSKAVTKDVTVAASAMGVEISVVEADNNRAIEIAFATLVRTRVEALLIGTDRSSSVGGSSWLRWRRVMQFLPPLMHVSSRKSAG
jgi:putative ABC transport system substrate-binding protein